MPDPAICAQTTRASIGCCPCTRTYKTVQLFCQRNGFSGLTDRQSLFSAVTVTRTDLNHDPIWKSVETWTVQEVSLGTEATDYPVYTLVESVGFPIATPGTKTVDTNTVQTFSEGGVTVTVTVSGPRGPYADDMNLSLIQDFNLTEKPWYSSHRVDPDGYGFNMVLPTSWLSPGTATIQNNRVLYSVYQWTNGLEFFPPINVSVYLQAKSWFFSKFQFRTCTKMCLASYDPRGGAPSCEMSTSWLGTDAFVPQEYSSGAGAYSDKQSEIKLVDSSASSGSDPACCNFAP